MTGDKRLIPAALSTWGAAWILVQFSEWSWVAAGVAAIFVFLLMCALPLRRATTLIAASLVCIAAVGLVATAVAVSVSDRQPEIFTEWAHYQHNVVADIAVTSESQTTNQENGLTKATRYRGEVVSASVGQGPPHQIRHTPVMVFTEDTGENVHTDMPPTPPIQIGDTVRVTGQLVKTHPGDNVAFLFMATGTFEHIASAQGLVLWAHQLRHAFLTLTATLPGDGGTLLPGLAIGDTNAVKDDLDAAMKASSLSHLTAVSGANCAIITACIMGLCALLALARWVRILAALASLAVFVVLVTPQPSVLRAAVMACIVLVALYLGRPSGGISALAIAVIVLLVIDPWLARDYGFALSVFATAGLLLLAGPLTDIFSLWMPTRLATAIALPTAAQMACQPVLILLNPTVSLLSIPANLLAAPAAPIATLVGLLSVLLTPFAQPLAVIFAWVAWVPAAWIAGVAQLVSTLPGHALPWVDGSLGALFIAIVTAMLVVLILYGRVLPRLWRTTVVVCVLIATGTYFGTLAGTVVMRTINRPTGWEIAACNVEQGDAVFVQNAGLYALIDVGPEPAHLTRCLELFGISSIELLVLTHYDHDHVGGIDAVIGKVRTALVGPSDRQRDDNIVEKLRHGGADVQQASEGDHGALGVASWEVLWPTNTAILSGLRGNDASVIVRIDSPDMSSVFLGDLGEQAQESFATHSHIAAVDVVKVAHHGSADQSAQLYQRLGAAIGIISVAAKNDYGHPTQHLLDILTQTGTAVLRTDHQGSLTVKRLPLDPHNISVWSERSEKPAQHQEK